MRPTFRQTRKWPAAGALSAMTPLGSCWWGQGKASGGPSRTWRKIAQVSPRRGHVDGGETVVIRTKGFRADFTRRPPTVYFGAARAMVTRVDVDAVEVTAPPYRPGRADILIRVNDTWEAARREDGFTYHDGQA